MTQFIIKFSDNQIKRIDELKEALGLNSKAVVIRKALAFLSSLEFQLRDDSNPITIALSDLLDIDKQEDKL